MRKNQREGYSQSYNAQVVVDAEGSQLMVGQWVSDSATDAGQLEPDVQSIPKELGQPTAVLADCGYAAKADFQRLGRERAGLELYVSVYREEAHAQRRYDYRPLDKVKRPRRLRDPVLVAMAEKLTRPEGRTLYRRRVCTVEPGLVGETIRFLKQSYPLEGLRLLGSERLCHRVRLVMAAAHVAAGWLGQALKQRGLGQSGDPSGQEVV